MENISIKVHPPWYARGTPVSNTRDGPSARGEPGEGKDRGKGQGRGRGGSIELAVGSWQLAVARLPARQHQCGENEIAGQGRRNPDSYRGEDRSRGKPKGKTRRWLTLKTTFFNAQNSVYSQWCAVLGSDLSACAAPDNVIKLKSKFNADRACPDLSGSIDAVRSGEAVVGFDLSAFAEPDNVKIIDYNVEMNLLTLNRSIGDADRSEDAVRSGKAVVGFDLSAFAEPDKVKIMDYNVESKF